MFICKNLKIEAKRTVLIVILFLKNEKKRTFGFFKNVGQKTKRFDSKLSKFCHSYIYCSHLCWHPECSSCLLAAFGLHCCSVVLSAVNVTGFPAVAKVSGVPVLL